jgi:hypothetical protein
VAELEGGTLTSSAGDLVSLLVRPARLRMGGWGTRWWRGLVVGTLLGPEGTGRPLDGGGWLSLEGFMPVVPSGGSCVGLVRGLAVGDVE